MSTTTVGGTFSLAGTNGATITAWKASRFGSAPGFNSAAPSGSSDAGPVTTDDSFGGVGAFTITLPTDDEPYYLAATYSGNTSWIYYPGPASGGEESPWASTSVVTVAGSDVTVPWAQYQSTGGDDTPLLVEASDEANSGLGFVLLVGTFSLGTEWAPSAEGYGALGSSIARPEYAPSAVIDASFAQIDLSAVCCYDGIQFMGGSSSPIFTASDPPGVGFFRNCIFTGRSGAGFCDQPLYGEFDGCFFKDDLFDIEGLTVPVGPPGPSQGLIIRGGALQDSVNFDATDATSVLRLESVRVSNTITLGGFTQAEVVGCTGDRLYGTPEVSIDSGCIDCKVVNNLDLTISDSGSGTVTGGNY